MTHRPAEATASDGRSRLPYVGAWDGLRAVAVLAVLVYHAGFGVGRGGWLGVSTFFTLSGYLITSLLLATRSATGQLSLRAFWARRARRLLPAASAGMALALGWTAVLASTEQRSQIAGDVAAALTYVTNWRYVHTGTSYADLFTRPSPLQHYWSLAIEEQFYLLFPLLVGSVLLLGRLRDRSRPRRSARSDATERLAGLLALGALTSGLWTAWLSSRGASFDRLYYGTDTRAAELLVGAALAAAVRGRTLGPATRRSLATLAPLALGALIYLYAFATLGSPWLARGGFVGVALLAAVVIEAARDGRSVVARVLGVSPLRSLGVVSYGIYLYHWPLFLWLREAGWSPVPVLVVGGTLAVLAANVSYRFLEAPIRSGAVVRREARILAPALAVTALCAAALVLGRPQRSTDPLTLLAQAETTGVAPAPSLPPPEVGDTPASGAGRG